MLVESPSLQAGLRQLMSNGAMLALRVEGYIPAEVCRHAQRHTIPQTLQDSFRRIYRSQVRSFTDTLAGGHDDLERYLAQSHAIQRELRKSFFPFANPADILRSELDEIYRTGANLLRFDSRPLIFGMMRSWESEMTALPHFDIIGEMYPQLGQIYDFRDQFGVNLYLEGPAEGGELIAWDLTLDDLRDRGISAAEGTYGYDRRLLPEPSLRLVPHSGDLVIIKSTRLHGVERTLRGRRVSISGFIGLREDALFLWS
jgi:hypothetical protein